MRDARTTEREGVRELAESTEENTVPSEAATSTAVLPTHLGDNDRSFCGHEGAEGADIHGGEGVSSGRKRASDPGKTGYVAQPGEGPRG